MITPKTSAGYRLGIVNPLTLVGEEIKSILRGRSFPFAKVVLMTSAGEPGALTEVADEPAVVNAVTDDDLEDLDLVFFCGDSEANREWIARYEDDRFIAIDLSQPPAAEEGTLAVAGLNLDTLTGGERLLVSPHPIAIPIALILAEFAALSPVTLCAASVIQPVSEFDQAGVEELARQTIAVLNVQGVSKELFDRQVAFNLFPALAGGEERIAGQIRALTGTDVALMVTQGTLFHAHTFSLFIKTKDALDPAQVAARFARNRVFAFAEGDQQFGTIDAAGRDEVLIAELRPQAGTRDGFWVWAASDNLRRGSALNAVLTAETLLFGTGAN